MIHLYAIVAGAVEPPPGTRCLDVGGLTAVVGPPAGDDRDDLVHHGLVVEQLAREADAVLPARFGERFADERALAASIGERLARVEARLAEVAGALEVTVRMARSVRPPRRPAVAGAEYMRMRLRDVAADGAAVAELLSSLESLAVASVAAPPRPELLFDGSFLVRRDDVDAFASAVQEYGDAHPDLVVACTGPWAPSSFAEVA